MRQEYPCLQTATVIYWLHEKDAIRYATNMKNYFCWRCKTKVPMLEEAEWNRLVPSLTNHIEEIKRI
jgi:hypothetical protein